jgi:hypothetical protein
MGGLCPGWGLLRGGGIAVGSVSWVLCPGSGGVQPVEAALVFDFEK